MDWLDNLLGKAKGLVTPENVGGGVVSGFAPDVVEDVAPAFAAKHPALNKYGTPLVGWEAGKALTQALTGKPVHLIPEWAKNLISQVANKLGTDMETAKNFVLNKLSQGGKEAESLAEDAEEEGEEAANELEEPGFFSKVGDAYKYNYGAPEGTVADLGEAGVGDVAAADLSTAGLEAAPETAGLSLALPLAYGAGKALAPVARDWGAASVTNPDEEGAGEREEELSKLPTASQQTGVERTDDDRMLQFLNQFQAKQQREGKDLLTGMPEALVSMIRWVRNTTNPNFLKGQNYTEDIDSLENILQKVYGVRKEDIGNLLYDTLGLKSPVKSGGA